MTTPTYASPEEVAGKLREEFIKLYTHLFAKEPILDPARFKARGRSGAEAEIHNDRVNKQALVYAGAVANFWLGQLTTQRREDLEGHIAFFRNPLHATDFLRNEYGLEDGDTLDAGEVADCLEAYTDSIISHLTTLLAQDKK